MLSLVISTIVFFMAAWYLNRYLDEQEIPKGMARGAMVLVLSALMSWGAGWSVDWAQDMAEGQQATDQTLQDLSHILNAADQAHPNTK